MTLCSHFKMSVGDFVAKYCRWADYYYGTQVLSLQEKKNYDCILWENGCSAYEARPIQCSTYPFWSWMIGDKETWDDCAKECPGMNKGRLWPLEEIEKQGSDNHNPPICLYNLSCTDSRHTHCPTTGRRGRAVLPQQCRHPLAERTGEV